MKPTVGIFGLTGCAGDQLAILNCEDELLDLVELLDVRDFVMAASGPDAGVSLDIAFVEGAVASHRDEERLRRIRERSRTLVAIGTCAVWGGVAALDRFVDRAALLEEIYGPTGRTFDQLSVRALHEVVPVEHRITGCPIERKEFLDAVACLLNGDPPLTAGYSVCAECRMRENTCLLLERGLPCLGAVTAAGCDARCPTLGVACIGCRGPSADANLDSLLATLEARGRAPAAVRRMVESFAPVSASAGLVARERR
jgi:coenzyme F420-reducing hydrogenase gamma subunit